MKRYSISRAYDHRGYHFTYMGRTDNVEETIEEYKASTFSWGIRITDSITKEVVFEDKRPLKGELIITTEATDKNFKGEKHTYSEYYHNLDEMRKEEHTYLYQTFDTFKVLKVERVIHSI